MRGGGGAKETKEGSRQASDLVGLRACRERYRDYRRLSLILVVLLLETDDTGQVK